MGKIISICNLKGGCGKTTTTQSLAAALSLRGNRCLVVDLDPQANLTLVSKVDDSEGSIYDLMIGKLDFDRVYQTNNYYDIIPADISLNKADRVFVGKGKQYILKDVLDPLKERYDYILIDTAPTLNILTINSLTASDYVIIPTEQSFYAIQSLDLLYETITEVKDKYNRDLTILGLLYTKHTERSNVNRLMSALIDRFVQAKKIRVFDTKIKESSAVSILQVIPRKHPVKDYKNLANEVDTEFCLKISNIS